MARKPRMLSDGAAAVLSLFVREPEREAFGLEIIRETGIMSGTLYPVVHRFEERGLLKSSWEDFDDAVADGRRPRKKYRLDPAGAKSAQALLDEWQRARRRAAASTPSPRIA